MVVENAEQGGEFDVPQLLMRRKTKHLGRRVAAQLIDLMLIAIAGNLLTVAFGDAVGWLVLPALILYFTLFEAGSGQTPGKRAMGLRVVNAKGALPSTGSALARNVIRPLEGFGLIGIIMVGGTQKGQRFGDLLAATYVIQTEELQNLAAAKPQIVTNQTEQSRQIILITSSGLELAKTLIASAFKPDDTGLSIITDPSLQSGLAVQLDYIDEADDSWHHTTDGVTVSVPRELADLCAGLQISAHDGKLIVDEAE